jgi:hypothetical protein
LNIVLNVFGATKVVLDINCRGLTLELFSQNHLTVAPDSAQALSDVFPRWKQYRLLEVSWDDWDFIKKVN